MKLLERTSPREGFAFSVDGQEKRSPLDVQILELPVRETHGQWARRSRYPSFDGIRVRNVATGEGVASSV